MTKKQMATTKMEMQKIRSKMHQHESSDDDWAKAKKERVKAIRNKEYKKITEKDLREKCLKYFEKEDL